jgi:hypothetical protein
MNRRRLLVPAILALALSPSAAVPWPLGPAPSSDLAASFGLAATAARLDALERRIQGSVSERRAWEYLNYRRVETGVASCMRAHGRPYRMSPYVSFYQDFTDADWGFSGRATAIDRPWSGQIFIKIAAANARMARSGVTEPTPQSPADVPVLQACMDRYHDQPWYSVDAPPGVYQLSNLTEILDAVYRDPDVVAAMRDYPTCVKARYAMTVTDLDDFLFAERIFSEDAPRPFEPVPAAWRRGVGEITRAETADADCRHPAYVAGMKIVAAHIGEWEYRHRAELAALDRTWHTALVNAAHA